MVGDYINAMKTTFDFNLDWYQTLKQQGFTYTNIKEKLSIQKASL